MTNKPDTMHSIRHSERVDWSFKTKFGIECTLDKFNDVITGWYFDIWQTQKISDGNQYGLKFTQIFYVLGCKVSKPVKPAHPISLITDKPCHCCHDDWFIVRNLLMRVTAPESKISALLVIEILLEVLLFYSRDVTFVKIASRFEFDHVTRMENSTSKLRPRIAKRSPLFWSDFQPHTRCIEVELRISLVQVSKFPR